MQKRPRGWQTALADPNHVGELLVTIAGTEYTAQDIVDCVVERKLLEKTVEVGNAVAAVLTLKINPRVPVPRQAEIMVQYRLRLGEAYTDYIPKGRYWVNTREQDGRYIKLICYDAMLKAEQDYLTGTTADDWPKAEADCVAEIARRIGVEVDPRTSVGDTHRVSMPQGKTMREVLREIGTANGGNWCISEANRLWLVPLAGTGDETEPVGGRPDTDTPIQLAGVRLLQEDENAPCTAGDMTGYVLEASLPDATQADAERLLDKLRGLTYQPYRCEWRHIDPLAENGDTVLIGGGRYLLYNIRQNIGPAFYADLEAPAESGELEQEYPYLTTAQRTRKQVARMQSATVEIRESQDEITQELMQTQDSLEAITEEIQKSQEEIRKEVKQTQDSLEATTEEIQKRQEEIRKEVKQTQDSLDGYTKTSEVRSRFAADASDVTIESGRVAFLDGTITIDGESFKLTDKGEVTAAGIFRSDGENGQCLMENGEIRLKNAKGKTVLQLGIDADGNGHLILNGQSYS